MGKVLIALCTVFLLAFPARGARFSSALTAGEQAVGRIRPRGLPISRASA